MNKRRLLKLADLLEADAKNKKGIKFALDVVGIRSDGNEQAPFVPEVSCGTTACAMGLAAISGAFKRSAGLSYKISKFNDLDTTINGLYVEYDLAAAKVFEIDPREARFLFSPVWYGAGQPTRGAEGERYVAKRIRDFVAGKVGPGL